MDPYLRDQLRLTYLTRARQWERTSPLLAALCERLGAGPSPVVAELMARYFRMASDLDPEPSRLLAALHFLALGGLAQRSAAFLPSCGGVFTAEQAPALAAAAEADLAEHGDEALDFMLSQDPADEEVQACALLVPGVLATTRRFGGGVSLVQAGALTGIHLLMDRFRCQFEPAADLPGDGARWVGAPEPAPPLTVTVTDGWPNLERLLQSAWPPVVGRAGLGEKPIDLTDPAVRLVMEACLPPDHTDRIERLRSAAALLAADRGSQEPAVVRPGAAEHDLAALLVEQYNRMPSRHTLLVVDALHWHRVTDEQQKRMTLAVQGVAAQLRSHRPMAWLQLARFMPDAPMVELRLQTFGWSHPEDRDVIRLAQADLSLRSLRWLDSLA